MVDTKTQKEIDKTVNRILKEVGVRRPPIDIDDILHHLELNRDFYSLEDPSLIARVMHKVKVGGQQLIKITKKIKLCALWFPDGNKILVDSDLPKPKIKWATLHDTTHSILEWHRPFFLGDTAQTLDPDFQESLENEANYGASALMFAGELFSKESLDTSPCWESVKKLSDRYNTSLVTTARRYVQFSHDKSMAVLISTPWWMDKPADQKDQFRHFVKSQKFENQFGNVSPGLLINKIDDYVKKRIGGPVGSDSFFFRRH